MRLTQRQREGFALAVSLAAIVVIGALIAGAFWSSMQHYRATRNTLSQERALNAAEFGQNWVLANWNSAKAKAMALGDTVSFAPTVPGGLGTADVRMTRLNLNTFWVVSEGKSGAGEGAVLQSRARTNLILRLDTPNIYLTGALTTANDFGMGGNAKLYGDDANPPGWTQCPTPGESKPTIVNDNPAVDITVTETSNCGGSPCLNTTASPKVGTDPKAGLAETYESFGGISWDTLTMWATTKYPSKVYASGTNLSTLAPVAAGSTCSTTNTNNWGEPNTDASSVPACRNYYPVIWAQGNLKITGVRGQGILLVDGDLNITGKFDFKGLVIVKGKADMQGTSGDVKITGGMMVAGTGSKFTGNSSVQYSSCALSQVLAQQDPPPVPVAARSWGDMY